MAPGSFKRSGRSWERSASNGSRNRIPPRPSGHATASWEFPGCRSPSSSLKGPERTCKLGGVLKRNLPGSPPGADANAPQLALAVSHQLPALGRSRSRSFKAAQHRRAVASGWALQLGQGGQRPSITGVGEGQPGQQTTATGASIRIRGGASHGQPIDPWDSSVLDWQWSGFLCSWVPARRPGNRLPLRCACPEGAQIAIAAEVVAGAKVPVA